MRLACKWPGRSTIARLGSFRKSPAQTVTRRLLERIGEITGYSARCAGTGRFDSPVPFARKLAKTPLRHPVLFIGLCLKRPFYPDSGSKWAPIECRSAAIRLNVGNGDAWAGQGEGRWRGESVRSELEQNVLAGRADSGLFYQTLFGSGASITTSALSSRSWADRCAEAERPNKPAKRPKRTPMPAERDQGDLSLDRRNDWCTLWGEEGDQIRNSG